MTGSEVAGKIQGHLDFLLEQYRDAYQETRDEQEKEICMEASTALKMLSLWIRMEIQTPELV